MDKAGAYGIQGYGATIVARVDGMAPIEEVTAAVRKSAHAHPHKPQIDFAAYRAAGGYALLARNGKPRIFVIQHVAALLGLVS